MTGRRRTKTGERERARYASSTKATFKAAHGITSNLVVVVSYFFSSLLTKEATFLSVLIPKMINWGEESRQHLHCITGGCSVLPGRNCTDEEIHNAKWGFFHCLVGGGVVVVAASSSWWTVWWCVWRLENRQWVVHH